MGFSNNKWRKILYILMIINLCFILFAKFTKVFGYNSDELTPVTINGTVYNFDIDYLTSQYDYYFMTAVSGSSYGIVDLFCFNNEPIVNQYGNSVSINGNGSQFINFHIRDSSLANANSYWNSHSFDISLGSYTYSSSVPIMSQSITTSASPTLGSSPFVLSNFDIKNSNGNIIYDKNVLKYPEIANTQEQLETLDFDVLSVNAWDFSNEDFDVLFYDLNYGTDTTDSLYPFNIITLNKDSKYYNSSLTSDPDKNAIYWIPIEEMGFNWVKGNEYAIRFAVRNYDVPGGGGFRGEDFIYHYIGDVTVFTVSDTVQDKSINALNNSTQNYIQNNQHEETMNNLNNINDNLNNVNDSLTNTTPDNSVSSDINSSLDFNNQNEGLNNLNNGFFSRLTSMLSNLLGYNLAEDTSVSIPLPNSNKNLVLHSKNIYDNVTGALRLIINAFWVYIFSFYMWKFINKIYIAISTGNILDTFSSSGEAITNDML